MSVEMGRTVEDKITGFRGVVTGRAEYITGCNQILVAPSVTGEGNFRDSAWLDEQRLEHADEGPAIVLDNRATPGPDKAPPRR